MNTRWIAKRAIQFWVAVAPVLIPMQAAVLYSTGFEAPTFTTGPIAGQDSWATYGTSSAVQVEGTVAKTGTQAVEVIPSLATGQSGPYRTTQTTGPFVDLSADIYLASSSTETSWQFGALGSNLIGYLGGIDIARATNTITLISAGSPEEGTFARDVWNHVDLLFNITAQTYSFSLNGVLLASNAPFCGNNSGPCSGANLNFYNGFFDSFASITNENDIGYIDNYSVIVSATAPEPGSAALLALGCLIAAAVKTRRATRPQL